VTAVSYSPTRYGHPKWTGHTRIEGIPVTFAIWKEDVRFLIDCVGFDEGAFETRPGKREVFMHKVVLKQVPGKRSPDNLRVDGAWLDDGTRYETVDAYRARLRASA